MKSLLLTLAITLAPSFALAYEYNKFDIDGLTGTGEVEKGYVYVNVNFQIKACVREVFERYAQKAKLGMQFKVSDGKWSLKTETDEEGCLNWVEKHHVVGANEAGDAAQVKSFDFPRYIIGTEGGLEGMQVVKVGVAYKNGKFMVDRTDTEGVPFRIERRTPYFSLDEGMVPSR